MTLFGPIGVGGKLIAQMAMISEYVIFRQRVAEVVRLGKAREGAQILSVGPERVVSGAAFIAAGIDPNDVVERGHAELLKRVFRQVSTGGQLL
jgi:hypothetical protein